MELLDVELEWKLRRSDTANQYCVLAMTVPPGFALPLHHHPEQEAFFVLEGEPEFAVGNRSIAAAPVFERANPGDMINVPPSELHGFRNTSNREARILLTCEAQLGRFFEDAGAPLADNESLGPHVSRESLERVLDIARRHGHQFPEFP